MVAAVLDAVLGGHTPELRKQAARTLECMRRAAQTLGAAALSTTVPRCALTGAPSAAALDRVLAACTTTTPAATRASAFLALSHYAQIAQAQNSLRLFLSFIFPKRSSSSSSSLNPNSTSTAYGVPHAARHRRCRRHCGSCTVRDPRRGHCCVVGCACSAAPPRLCCVRAPPCTSRPRSRRPLCAHWRLARCHIHASCPLCPLHRSPRSFRGRPRQLFHRLFMLFVFPNQHTSTRTPLQHRCSGKVKKDERHCGRQS